MEAPVAWEERPDWGDAAPFDAEEAGAGPDALLPLSPSAPRPIRQALMANARGSAVRAASALRAIPLRCAFMSIILRCCPVVLTPALRAPMCEL